MSLSLMAYIDQGRLELEPVLEQEIFNFSPLIQPVLKHILLTGGKRVRFLLVKSVYTLCSPNKEPNETEKQKYLKLGLALELLHAASLLHDDVVDNADSRRGQESTHKKFGLGLTVLAGDLLLARSVQLVADLQVPVLSKIFSQAIIETAQGEISELNFLKNIELSEAEYYKIIEGKTAWLLRASCELSALLACAEEKTVTALTEYGLNLGLGFQVVDDALDFSPSSKDTGKPVGGDLRECKLTPPIRMYYQSLNVQAAEKFAEKFQGSGFSEDEIKDITKEIAKLGLEEKTRAIAEGFLKKAGASLKPLSLEQQSKDAYKVLYALLEYIRNRKG
ncbi:polyprenyl synthetase family protein [Desulfovibrio litoralis]|uniref:Octaprenyl-diphosphate synthase n=1 Tax=Desulfovibrio litoralis DSM 11393 TaxID=1121455 RepID=A0A1M7RWW9_9BACT|nr:polyprenyl synthetase family protein [Desulfovibrio litoralis]SHN50522.1 octaprenyl-diphosphate synthase [Desulfovibrio litoralis DSM 11393]